MLQRVEHALQVENETYHPGVASRKLENTMISILRWLSLFLLFWQVAVAQKISSPAGDWVSNLKYFGNDNYDRLRLELNGTRLTGKLGDDQFNGTFQNGTIAGTVKPDSRETVKLTGKLNSDRIEGTATIVEEKVELKWEAYRATPKR